MPFIDMNALPTMSPGNDFLFMPIALSEPCFMPEATCAPYIQKVSKFESRPGNYRYLDGINDAFEYGMRY